MKEYENFEAWNPNKEVARAAELLYGHIENLELYPGLMAECTKPAIPGSGVCPGQTTGRGILDDAVSLVRGDRFLSYDFNSNTLTNWGASLLQEGAAGSYGGMLPRLIFNALPGAFNGTSSYALLQFYTPEAAKGILEGNKVVAKYDLTRPASDMNIISIQTQAGCKQVLEDRENFTSSYETTNRNYANGHDFKIGLDDAKQHDEHSKTLQKIFFEDGFEKKVYEFFSTNVEKLIEKNSLSFTTGTKSIDVVRDVANVTPILWLAERFAIPLKTQEQPYGLLSTFELFSDFLAIYLYQNCNVMSVNEWKLRESTRVAETALQPIFEAHLKMEKGIDEEVVEWLAKDSPFEVGAQATRIYHALNDTKLSVSELVANCIGLGAPIAGNLTHQASLLIDLFLSPDYETDKKRIVELANMDWESSERELQGFVFEGIRHAGVVFGLPRVASKDITVVDGVRGPVNIKAGHTVLVATSKAAMDPIAFPNPEKLNPNRPFEDYTLLGYGLDVPFASKLIGYSLAATLKEVFKLKNVRKAPGKLGNFTFVEHDVAGISVKYYLDSSSKESPVPTSLTIEYDA